MTYYDYFNIFFDAQHPPGGRFNQFVPQLMLGDALANSSGPPDYTPQWLQLHSWHIGAQYFMEYNKNGSDAGPWSAAAATGELVPVSEGDEVKTTFSLSEDGETWTLRMEVLGGGPDKVSVVVADSPFMGLLNTTKSWKEFSATKVGSCWENYGMKDRSSFPPGWSHRVAISGTEPGLWWTPWLTREPTCPWAPRATVSSSVSFDGTTQSVDWEIFFPARSGVAGAESDVVVV